MGHDLKVILFLVSFIICFKSVYAQNRELVVFYNVENLFDPVNDPRTQDDEFTVSGTMRWNNDRYVKKQKDIFKVMADVGGWSPPAVICLSEIESKKVALDLINNTPLVNWNYKVIHYDSPDERGIDVALLYREPLFSCDTSYVLPVFLAGSEQYSRDILIVKGTFQEEPVCFMVNHWPSRRGGIASTEKYRLQASEVMLQKAEEFMSLEPDLKLIITGDFNDEVQNESLQRLTEKNTAVNLQVLSCNHSKKVMGTLKYKGRWFTFDHFIVSANMLNDDAGLSVLQKKANIFEADYLLRKEKKVKGYRPFRTYQGSYYAGGYSDHLPVYIILYIK